MLEGKRVVYDVVKMRTPGPPFLRHRSKFQSASAEERLAFYNASNYHFVLQAALMEQARADHTRPLVIVLDRWWISSLCGFCVEQRLAVENISDLGMWPADLPQPARSSTVCITVEESVRIARLSGRNEELTWQEKDLEHNVHARAIARALYHQCQKQGCLQFVSNDTVLRDCVAAIIKIHFPNWTALE